jgi:hypothetical protein
MIEAARMGSKDVLYWIGEERGLGLHSKQLKPRRVIFPAGQQGEK